MKIRIYNLNTNEEIMVLEGQIKVRETSILNERNEGLNGVNFEVVGYEILESDPTTDFDSEKAVGDCYALLPLLLTSANKRAAWGPLADMIRYKQFAGIKAYSDALIADSTITAEEYAQINDSIFKPQGVDLDNLGGS